jgi:acetyl-CoA synthetase
VLNVSPTTASTAISKKRGDQVAIIWEGDDPYDDKKITYRELHARLPLANVLKAHGVKKGDRVTIYMPMIPEAAYAMLACARIGAIHSVVFGGFSPDSLAGRIVDCEVQGRHHRRRGPARRQDRSR